VAAEIGFPILVRPSYVLGGRAMRIVYDDASLKAYFEEAVRASPGHPILIDSFLEDAFEADVDALSDGTDVVIGGIMQHIEQAGVHSGDSSCVLPAHDLPDAVLDSMRETVKKFARELGVIGLMNTQFAIYKGEAYTIEVNPRASRTIPFVSKAIGVPLAKVAARVMAGETLEQIGFTEEIIPKMVSVKKVVLPFRKLGGSDPVLGPEMKSTGEVMGIAATFGQAFAKATMGAGERVPTSGTVFLSVNDEDKVGVVELARSLSALNFHLIGTRGTAAALDRAGIACQSIYKVNEGRPNLVDYVKNNEIDLVINTPLGRESRFDERAIRMASLEYNIPCITTLAAAQAMVRGIVALSEEDITVRSVQEWYRQTSPPA
jgi:carbamoyl-phosphate synthase large subunit